MAPKYRLTYFNAKALGESVRLLLSYGKIDFEDIRIKTEDWPKIKDSTPMGRLPMLEIGNKVYYQSRCITRYLGYELGLAGSNNAENTEIEMSVDDINDFREAVGAASYETDEAVKERKYKEVEDIIPFVLKKLDERAAANKGHLALGKLTWADFYLTGMIDYMSHISRVDIKAKYPNLKAVVNNVLALPAIKAWNEKAPAFSTLEYKY